MKHKAPTFVRIGRRIQENGGTVQTYPSISAAKKASLQLQMANGGRGCGYVRVAKGK